MAKTVEVFGTKIKTASRGYGLLVARNRKSGDVFTIGFIHNPARAHERLRKERRARSHYADVEFVRIP